MYAVSKKKVVPGKRYNHSLEQLGCYAELGFVIYYIKAEMWAKQILSKYKKAWVFLFDS